MRILKWLVGGVALLLGGAFVWGRQRVSRARAARVESLAPCAANQLITGGPHAAVVKLVDVHKREVLCQREVSFHLPEELLPRRPFVPFANASGAA
ncbi:hypothetical protein HPP05_00635 [Corallococcus exiguus]|uniref:hypothetical protein n=1 Tax=Corallococcus TaxID=83461 RepID=UPI001315725D|nr:MULTISPECIES: hypothetical protein [Corallococcus]NPC68254.1 hypothetical protein [Corallococcus exiguus]